MADIRVEKEELALCGFEMEVSTQEGGAPVCSTSIEALKTSIPPVNSEQEQPFHFSLGPERFNYYQSLVYVACGSTIAVCSALAMAVLASAIRVALRPLPRARDDLLQEA